MPCIGFICPATRDEVGFDHFDTCTHGIQGRAAASPWLSNSAAHGIASDLRHQGTDMTATRLLGCPREVYIQSLFDYYIDPDACAVRDRGTSLHREAAKHMNSKLFMTELTDPVRMTVAGHLFPDTFDDYPDGVPISALLDCIRRWSADTNPEIIDWKFPKDWSVPYRTRPKPEHAVQLNVQRLLLSQQDWAKELEFEKDKCNLTIWDHGIGKPDGPRPLPQEHMTEDQILKVKPFGGIYTIRDIVQTWIAAQELHKAAGDPSSASTACTGVACAIPLVGESMMHGAKCMQYCDVSKTCERITAERGRPETQGMED